MEKIEQLEQLKNAQVKTAQKFGLERLLRTPDLSTEEMENRCLSQIVDALKREISSHLSSIDAVFTASIVLQEPDLTVDIINFLSALSTEVEDFVLSIASFDEDDEEGGDDEIS